MKSKYDIYISVFVHRIDQKYPNSENSESLKGKLNEKTFALMPDIAWATNVTHIKEQTAYLHR